MTILFLDFDSCWQKKKKQRKKKRKKERKEKQFIKLN